MADAAAYQSDGTLFCTNASKCIAIPTLRAAISCTGPVTIGGYFALHLTQRFESFDDLVARADDILPGMFQEFADSERDGDANSSVYIIGWHEKDARPAAYCMDMWTDESTKIAQVLANGTNAADVQAGRFKLNEQLFAGTPMPGPDLIAAAGLKIPNDVNDVDPELDLLHLIEIQRHERIQDGFWVGGKAMLTTIDCHGITQRVVHHWKEDQIGQRITPLPIEWKSWRNARIAAKVAAVVPEGLSRLQRQRMEKKARKGTLRIA